MEQNDIKYNLEGLLFSYYIKYDSLIKLNSQIDAPSDTKYIDIYIDVFDMLRKVYSVDIYASKKFLIVSSIINLAAHLRGYYLSRHRIWPRIFLVYGEESTNNHRQFVHTFGQDKVSESLRYDDTKSFIESQLELAKILCAYINDVYLIKKSVDFSVFTYHNILDTLSKNPDNISVIITKSDYAYQIPALLPNTYIFRPKKTKLGDCSYIISFKDVLFKYYNKIHKENILQNLKIISPKLLSILMCLTGIRSKNISSATNIIKASNLLASAIVNHKILNDYNSDTVYLYNKLEGINLLIDPASFEYRFKAIDVNYQTLLYNMQSESLDYSWKINLKNIKAFQEINNKYFIDNPLDVNNL